MTYVNKLTLKKITNRILKILKLYQKDITKISKVTQKYSRKYARKLLPTHKTEKKKKHKAENTRCKS